MLAKRIIPCLDVRNGKVVKGVNFEGIKDVGDPVECAYAYNQQGADEIVFYDITASYEGRGVMLDVVRETAKKVFVPLTVGGGIKTVIASGGAGKLSDFADAFLETGCSAALAASLFHFRELTVQEVKADCRAKGIPMR